MKLILFFFTVLAIISCSENLITLEFPDQDLEFYRNRLCERGVTGENIEIRGDYISVDDIVIKKSDLDATIETNGQSVATQRSLTASTNTFVEIDNVENIAYYMAPDFQSRYSSQLNDVINEYEAIPGCRISFSSPSSSPVSNGINFVTPEDAIFPACFSTNLSGQAYFPSQNGNVGNFAYVNDSLLENNAVCNGIEDCCVKKVLRHEIGHTLGFLHVNQYSNGDICGNAVGAAIKTTTGNGNSFMKTGGLGTCNSFTNDDKYALTALFPESYEPASLWAYDLQVNPINSSICNFTFIPYIGAGSPTYEMEFEFYNSSGNMVGYKKILNSRSGNYDYNYRVGLKFMPFGQYTVKATLRNFNKDYEVSTNSRTLNVY